MKTEFFTVPLSTLKRCLKPCFKSLVEGRYCDRCKPQNFNLMTHKNAQRGCQRCFCNGLDVNCRSSEMFYEKISANFEEEAESWQIRNRFLNETKPVTLVGQNIEFDLFDEFENRDLFFIVPTKFLDNKVSFLLLVSLTLRLNIMLFYV